jgi:hypothetical protein
MVDIYDKMKGMKMKCRKIFVRMMAAAVCCAAVAGCMLNGGEGDAAAAGIARNSEAFSAIVKNAAE